MTYEVVMPYHLHMPSYFLGTFTEYPFIISLFYLFIIKYIVSFPTIFKKKSGDSCSISQNRAFIYTNTRKKISFITC